MTKTEFLNYLHDGDFKQLFLENFWDNPTTSTPYTVSVRSAPDIQLTFIEAAQKKGFRVYVCCCEALPDSATRRFVDAKLRKLSHDYLAIYVSTTEPFHHLWSVPVKTVDKRQLVTIEYVQDDQAAFLLEKMEAVSFREKELTIVDVVEQVNAAFLVNTADVTNRFYQGFRKQHDAFVKGIENLGVQADREWYASVMLNRLMFCYFIQKKRFLNFDENYLGNKLKEIQAKKGKDKFYESFYRSFLKQLFSDGLDKPVSGRSDYFLKKYGRIPYLNGGMFSQHQIEKENKDIDIPDKVFENLFAFFDQWCWHLDSRITASGRDINPDVLGYIFEQYINDRAQMGAYYTKEDITEYIGRNCIVPYLFEKVLGGTRSVASATWIWQFLRKSGDAYIFPAVRKGVDLPLPPNIEKGVDTVGRDLRARRADWNKPTDAAYALPTEIWRETVARRQRCAEVRAKIASGAITDIHDFITYNLDIRAFAEDVIRKTDDHKLVLHIYKVLREMTILDPTCGSGAFLFAALNILEPLYEACLDRMEEWHATNKNLFKDELEEIAGKFRSNRQYFIYKNVILRNLYGVDIMHEATEIARLRLFLKMVAVVDVDPYDENLGLDPLPDIDFNIRCGNTLVGYATEKEIEAGLINGDMFAFAELKGKIDSEMEKVSMAYDFFRREQLNLTGDHGQLVEAKKQIGQRLATIRNLLDDQLYDRHSGKKKAQWLADTQPFHWYTEFYPIMHGRGGFDVIIGNPPYVVYTEVGCGYFVPDSYKTKECLNLYAYCAERSLRLINNSGRFGMIVPNSSVSATKMMPLQRLITRERVCWISNYSWRPSKLFEGADMLLAILLVANSNEQMTYSTRYQKWYNEMRSELFQDVGYYDVTHLIRPGTIPKLPSLVAKKVLEKVSICNSVDSLGRLFENSVTQNVAFYFRAVQYWFKVLDRIPVFKEDGIDKVTGEMKPMYFADAEKRDMTIALLSSNLFFLNYILWSSCQVVNSRDFEISFNINLIAPEIRHKLCSLSRQLQDDYQKNSHLKVRNYSKKGREFTMEKQHFFIKFSKPIIDEIDELLAKHYGFTEEELDFIINYDIKYRMGDELNAE